MFTVVELELSDIDVVLEVMREEFGEDKVEVHLDDPKPIRGYRGDDRSKLSPSNKNYAPPCHLIVRKRHVGASSNDVGIHIAPNGKIKMYVSGFDRGGNVSDRRIDKMKENMAGKLKSRYAEKMVKRHARRAGYRIKRETLQDGTIRMRLQRR
jgi:hypothetical protein